VYLSRKTLAIYPPTVYNIIVLENGNTTGVENKFSRMKKSD